MISTKQKIFIARSAAGLVRVTRRTLGAGSVADVRRDGLNWRLDLGEGIDFAIYLLGAFERGTQKQYGQILKAGDVALDIGANIGAHTLPIARCVGPSGHVHAFEPTVFAFAKLEANIARNPELGERITAGQTLLSDSSEDVPPTAIASSWPLDGGRGGHPLHGGHEKPTEGAEAKTLDSYVAEAGLERIDFIKLDVDGNECQVLRGGQETLRRFRPPIILELAPYVFSDGENSFDAFIELLRGANYKLQRSPGGAALALDARALAGAIPEGASLNAWAMPA
ncbi:MAG: FkbM family methyltransferase [Rhodospirillaceae bacterium]|nr:FkbM family methyltransferase [Rhodospirillaceae bacterium]MBT3626602.1 FkbM family methyltransferase [Rhodospirillaceae bacterium]MBT3928437.1 FkbM family methyltransferase [Rhodospirillaceae bacterium]MBT4427154.1 FkbM family methyltransferase [Rhodospirillaceae bacterium]MBT7292516.1 FkbM family methyltransferase [Rhodospirillaceae bacterium]